MNNTTEEFNDATFLVNLREFYVEEQFGEHYHLIFIITFIVCFLGCITNSLNIVVFSKTNLTNSMNLLLLVLAVADIIFICIELTQSLHYFSGFKLYPFYGWVVFATFITFLETSFLSATNWIVAVVGFCRFVVITWPQRCARWFSTLRVKIIIIVLFTLSLLLGLPIFVVFSYEHLHYKGLDVYDLGFSDYVKANNHRVLKIFWVFLLLRDFVPMMITLISTFGLVWILYKRRKSSQDNSDGTSPNFNSYKTTAMLTILLALYWLSNFPDAFLLFMAVVTGGDSEIHGRFKRATDIIRIFSLTSNSLSFFIYYGLGVEFRSVFKRVFCVGSLCRKSKTSKDNSQVSEVVTIDDPENGAKVNAGNVKTSAL